MNTYCTSYDPIENLMTDIENMANQGFDYGQIYNRLFDPFSLRLKKYEEVIEHEPLYFYHRAFEAVMYYNYFNDEGYAWSDCVCWVYTDVYDFEHYEKVIYPTIKENTHLFDRLVFSDRKESLVSNQWRETV